MTQSAARPLAQTKSHASPRLPDSSAPRFCARRAEPRRAYLRTPVSSVRRMFANDHELGAWLRGSAHLSDSAVKQSVERLSTEEVFTVADLQVLHQIGGFSRVFSPVTAQKVAGALGLLEPDTARAAARIATVGARFGGRSLDFDDFDEMTAGSGPPSHKPWQALSKDQQLQLIASLRAEDAMRTHRGASSSPGGSIASSPDARGARSPAVETVPLHYRYSGRVVNSPAESETTPEDAVIARPAHSIISQWSHIRCVATLSLSEIIAAMLPPFPLAFHPDCASSVDEVLPRGSCHAARLSALSGSVSWS